MRCESNRDGQRYMLLIFEASHGACLFIKRAKDGV